MGCGCHGDTGLSQCTPGKNRCAPILKYTVLMGTVGYAYNAQYIKFIVNIVRVQTDFSNHAFSVSSAFLEYFFSSN